MDETSATPDELATQMLKSRTSNNFTALGLIYYIIFSKEVWVGLEAKHKRKKTV